MSLKEQKVDDMFSSIDSDLSFLLNDNTRNKKKKIPLHSGEEVDMDLSLTE